MEEATGKREAILSAASARFERDGYAETSIASIAADARVSPATLYAHFGGKEDLFRAAGRPELRTLDPGRAARRSRIQAAAVEAFSGAGFARTSMEEIAVACHCGKAAIYRLFSSKEELFESLFEEPDFFPDSEIVDHTGGAAKAGDFLFEAGLRFLRMFDDPARRGILRAVVAESGQFPRLGELMYQRGMARVAGTLAVCLRSLPADRELSPSDCELAARSFFGMLYSFVLVDQILRDRPRSFGDEALAGFAAKTFARGLGLDPGDP